MAQKKEVKVKDLKPKKDAKGGGRMLKGDTGRQGSIGQQPAKKISY